VVDSASLNNRFDGVKLFQLGFVIAVLVSTIVTYISITTVDPARPLPRIIFFIIALNALLCLLLLVLLVRRYRALTWAHSRNGEGRLVRRFMLLFSASAVIPSTVVAIFLGATVTQGLDNWFENRVGPAIEQAAILAQENIDGISTIIEAQSREVTARMDFEDTASGIENDPILYADYLGRQAVALGAIGASVVSDTGALIIMGTVPNPVQFVPPDAAALEDARNGLVGQILYQEFGVVTATVKLTYPENTFLHLVHELNPRVFERLNNAAQAVTQYRQAENYSATLQTFFAIGYAQVVVLALLLFARLGLEAANQVAAPLASLAKAAERVRDGDLTTRVAPPGNDDEIDTLTASFNTMTAQLGAQRSALLSARAISEDRRKFLESLLSQISAGVIRTDRAMTITLANASAESLLGQSNLQGRALEEVVPEFKTQAQAAQTRGTTHDTSLVIKIGGAAKHIRLRTLIDAEDGYVLTFDDATRIVTAQRHMAWRDVARRIAHEIRNPLTPIHLAAERLNRRYAKLINEDDNVFERSLDTITRQANDIGRMVDEFSNFARMPKPEIRPFNFYAMLSDIAFSQRLVSPDIKIEITTSTKALTFYGDERLLGQAFANLVKNAAEAISSLPEEMEVTGNITIAVEQTARGLNLTVEDNGPGFPDELRESLLEPYVTTRERGTGLGLAIVNRVIIDHGGSISLQKSKADKRGARVRIMLPLKTNSTPLEETPTTSMETT